MCRLCCGFEVADAAWLLKTISRMEVKHDALLMKTLIFVVLLLLSGCRMPTYYPARAVSYNQEQLFGVWIGFDSQTTVTYMLELKQAGEGTLSWRFAANPNWISERSVTWRVESSKLICHVDPTKSDGPITLECELGRNALQTTLKGAR